MSHNALSAMELARLAGYTIRRENSGGLDIREDIRLMTVGPDADELDILRAAHRHLVSPAYARPAAAAKKRQTA